MKEGADMLMVKPGMAYLDIVRQTKDRVSRPHLYFHPNLTLVLIKHGPHHAYSHPTFHIQNRLAPSAGQNLRYGKPWQQKSACVQ